MEQLQFTAVHEDGQHLVLSSPDGTEFRLPIDERLRSVLRSRGPAADVPATQLSPRDVQAMIRAGQTAAEVAEITGWPVERVARFEAPITAEREHVAGLARAAHVRGRGTEGVVPTLGSRVMERLEARGVDPENTSWDATRPAGGPWTVVVSFVAGQRQRAAAWRFEPADRTVEALDDEARWLSEDEQALPGSAAGRQLLGTHGASEEVDLVTSMRERSRTRGRRRRPTPTSEEGPPADTLPQAPEDVLPLGDVLDDEAAGGDATEAAPSGTPGGPATADGATEDTDGGTVDGDGATEDTEGASQGPDAAAAAGGGAGPAPGAAEGTTKGRRSRAGRGRAGRAKTSRPGPAASGPDTPGSPTRAGDKSAAAPTAPEAGPVTPEVELDFDENYEVDPRPQEATLADLFGPGDPPADELPLEDYLEDDLEDDLDALEDEGDAATRPDAAPVDDGSPAEPAAPAAGPLGDEPRGAAAAPDGPTDKGAAPDSGRVTFDNDDDVSARAQESADGEPDEGEPAAGPDDGAAPTAGPAGEAASAAGPAEEAAPTADPAGDAAPSAPKADSSQPGAKRRKDGRPGVPSWDDIVFGAKDRT